MSALTDAYRAHQNNQRATERSGVRLRIAVQLERGKGRTWTDIGDELGLSRSRVQRIAYPKGAGQ